MSLKSRKMQPNLAEPELEIISRKDDEREQKHHTRKTALKCTTEYVIKMWSWHRKRNFFDFEFNGIANTVFSIRFISSDHINFTRCGESARFGCVHDNMDLLLVPADRHAPQCKLAIEFFWIEFIFCIWFSLYSYTHSNRHLPLLLSTQHSSASFTNQNPGKSLPTISE